MKKVLIIISFIVALFGCTNKQTIPGFAIVIDEHSFENAKAEVEAYASSVEANGLKTFIVVDKWKQPDSIKNKLIELYNDENTPIEGAVFMGDIPVPMIRDAQHLTSAFKMDQERYPWQRSSVPSDRFYDDFDLDFEFFKRDSINNLFYYYALKEQSVQKLQPEIYSGRIKPFESDYKYEELKAYLKKVVRIKAESNTVDQLLYFGGHGYNSESMVARVDEKISLLDQFPWLKGQQNGLGYIDHSMDEHVKDRLMSELQRDDLDIAILHHHGADDTQYLSGMPQVDGVNQQIWGVKYYLRSKLRSAKSHGKDLEETKQYYKEKLGVPSNWFDGSFDKEVLNEDSIFNANLDIVIRDVKKVSPNTRFIILDACFNGSFQLDSSLSASYIFNDGNTVAVQANSVNALQDKWADELIGLLGLGMRIGNWSKHVAYLETHIIGDPTFQFTPSTKTIDWNIAITGHAGDDKFWLKQLDSEYADIQSLALRKLFENQYKGLSSLLFETFKTSTYATVRMECLKLLTAFNDNNFIECLTLACDDSNEFVQRQAIYLIGKSGDERLVNPLIKIAMRNNTAARLEFTIKQALSTFEKNTLLKYFPIIFEKNSHFTKPKEVKEAIAHSFEYNSSRWLETEEVVSDPEASDKSIKFNIRLLRNYNYHPGIEGFCSFIATTSNDDFRVMMLEALGWFNISHKKDIIIRTCRDIIDNDDYSERVKTEALRTLHRLETPWYR